VFTGIVEETGRIRKVEPRSGGAILQVEADLVLEGSLPGHSICVNGVCLTIEKMISGGFGSFLSMETIEKTTFSMLKTGDPVNLERALALGGRLGGHLVSGHAEGTGRIEEITREGETTMLTVLVAPDFSPFLVAKGSVAVDGVSLTIVDPSPERFKVALIPETIEKTTFRLKRPGDFVNLEPDMILKYVISAVADLAGPDRSGGITLERLKQSGFITD